MFPYRRGGKKRPKGGPQGRRGQDRGPRRMGGGGAYDLLNAMPSTTKALAQVLAGNARASGQLAHARNILAQAERMIDDRQVDRMIPADREDFLEQLARLKLTLADADVSHEQDEADAVAAAAAAPRPVMPPERLRELALSLAGELAAGVQQKADAAAQAAEDTASEAASKAAVEAAAAEAAADAREDGSDDAQRAGAAHRQPLLRLKRKADLADADR
jgi:hypothetical protein